MRNFNGNIGKGIEIQGLARTLRSIRKLKKLSVREMGTLLRIPHNTYWRAEQGAILLSTAWTIVRRMSRWKLPEEQAIQLQLLKERIVQR